MKRGTKSVLFGVHQFIVHPLFVAIAWILIYRKVPTVKELVCIFLHDIGYFGKPNMDGQEGERHPHVGADVAEMLFGSIYGDLVRYHSRATARTLNRDVSMLCLPDKLATLLYPKWMYIILGRLSGEIDEYKWRMGMRWASDGEWLDITKIKLYKWAYRNTNSEERIRLLKYFAPHLPKHCSRGDAVAIASENEWRRFS